MIMYYARRVYHSTWKTRSYSPHSAIPSTLSSARLDSARSLPRALARSPRARIARRTAAGADSLDIYMHTRYHSGEQSTRGTRTKRVSLCSPSLLLRPRERKEEERHSRERERERLEERSVLDHLRSSTQNWQKGSTTINCPLDQSILDSVLRDDVAVLQREEEARSEIFPLDIRLRSRGALLECRASIPERDRSETSIARQRNQNPALSLSFGQVASAVRTTRAESSPE